MQVLVVGDVMLDIYRSGRISRISPEAPVPVILNAQDTYSAGGAANVAVNLASMGLNVALSGITGHDENAVRLKEILDDAGILSTFLTADHQPTISKLRIIGNGHHITRIDTEGDFSGEAENLYRKTIGIQSPWVVLSDYNKGSLTQIERYIEVFQAQGAKVLVDPKREISAYKGAWLIKPNRNEFIKYIGEFSSHTELIEKAQQTARKYHFSHMLITLGSEGMMYVTATTAKFFPSVSQQVADITGAGDTVIAGLIYGLSNGCDLEESVILAKRLAELSVTKIGTYVVTQEDIATLGMKRD